MERKLDKLETYVTNKDVVISKKNGRYYFRYKSGAKVLTDKLLSRVWKECDGKGVTEVAGSLGNGVRLSKFYVSTALDVLLAAGLISSSDMEKQGDGVPEAGSAPDSGRVSVVIVNYNGMSHLPELLSSLSEQTYPNIEVIMVDNRSTDESVEYVRADFPLVKVLAQDRNVGFAGGNNVGIKVATGKYVFLLNNDTTCDRRAIERMVAVAEASPKPPVVAPLIKFYDLPGFINSVGNYVKPNGWGSDGYIGYVDTGILDSVEEVTSACFGAVMIPRTVLEDVGGLDEKYRFYYEDSDWSYRAWARGHRIVFAREAVVYHKFNSTMNTLPSSFKMSLVVSNRMRFALQNLSRGSAFLFARNYLKEDVRKFLGSVKRRDLAWLSILTSAYWRLFLGMPGILVTRRHSQRSRRPGRRDADLFALWPILPPLLDPEGNPILDSGAIRRIYMHPAVP